MIDSTLKNLEQCAYDYKNGEIDQFTHSHYELICQALIAIEDLKKVNLLFKSSCEIDGFGHVRNADFTSLTVAYDNLLKIS